MALTKYPKDTAVIANVGTKPEDRTDLTDETFKAKWDENATDWKTFFNETVSEELDDLITAIKGAGWTSESLKGLADLISTSDGKLTTHISDLATHGNILRQAVINGGFQINQRVRSGTVTLSAGVYGHDRWKAGASGVTYTFATSENVTTLTITAGSLVQVIDGARLKTGNYALSWTGTAQGKINAGSYGASGVTGAITGGTNATVEFGTGTLSNVQFNFGTAALPYVAKSFDEELRDCMKYYEKSYAYATALATTTVSGIEIKIVPNNTIAIAQSYGTTQFKVPKRTATPAVTIYPLSVPGNTGRVSTYAGGDLAANSGGVVASERGFETSNATGGTLATSGLAVMFHWAAADEL